MTRRRLRRRVPRRRRAASASAPRSRPATRRRSSTRSSLLHAMDGRRVPRCSAAASPSTAAATPRWTPPGRRAGSARPTRSSSTGAPATGCRPTRSRSRRPSRRACTMMWLSTITRADEGNARRSRRCSSTRPASRSRPASSRARGRHARAGPRPGTDLSLLDGVPGISIDDGVVQVGPDHDDRPSRHLRRRRHGARRAHGHGRPSATASGPRAASTPGCDHRTRRSTAPPPARSRRAGRRFERLNTWYYADAPASVRPQLEAARRITTFDEVDRRPRRDDRALRGAPLPVLRQLLRVRQLLRRLPGQRRGQARPRQRYEIDSTTARAAASAPRNARAGRSTWFPSRSEDLLPVIMRTKVLSPPAGPRLR